MKIASIITVYKQPALIEKALRAMQHDGFYFYLHIDKKIDIKPYQYLADFPNTFILKKRMDIKWAGYSMVECLLYGMEEALESGISYDFINHISGQCYPIKPIQVIHDYFDQHKGKNFISYELPPGTWSEEVKSRYEHYHFQDYDFKGKYRLGKFISTVLPKRKPPFGDTLYGSSLGAYWTITKEATAYLIDYFRTHRRVRDFFKFSWGPDEFLFNTILMYSDFRDRIINNNFRYIDWSAGGASPKILTVADFEQLRQSQCFFARKFDLDVDARILDLIDKKLLS